MTSQSIKLQKAQQMSTTELINDFKNIDLQHSNLQVSKQLGYLYSQYLILSETGLFFICQNIICNGLMIMISVQFGMGVLINHNTISMTLMFLSVISQSHSEECYCIQS